MSPQARSVTGLYERTDPGRSSPSLKKPKKAVQATAQITNFSVLDEANKVLVILAKTCTVTVNLTLVPAVPLRTLSLLMPACTLFSIGSDDLSLGSGGPIDICKLRSANRYAAK